MLRVTRTEERSAAGAWQSAITCPGIDIAVHLAPYDGQSTSSALIHSRIVLPVRGTRPDCSSRVFRASTGGLPHRCVLCCPVHCIYCRRKKIDTCNEACLCSMFVCDLGVGSLRAGGLSIWLQRGAGGRFNLWQTVFADYWGSSTQSQAGWASTSPVPAGEQNPHVFISPGLFGCCCSRANVGTKHRLAVRGTPRTRAQMFF